MTSKQLKAAVRAITSLLNEPRMEPGQRDQLERAKRELGTVERSGKLERDRIFRAVEIVANVALELAADQEARKPR